MRRNEPDSRMAFAGKDFFSAEEAAVYCGIPLGEWRQHVKPYIQSGRFMGRTIYRRETLNNFVERTADWETKSPGPAIEKAEYVESDLKRVATLTAEIMLARRPVPSTVTLKQAAEMLCISVATARKLKLRRDSTGAIPYEAVLAARDPY